MKNSCICYLEETVKKFPDKIAVKDNQTSYTFSQLRKRAVCVGSIIRETIKGEVKQPIAVYLPKNSKSIVAFAATLYSSNFYIPLDVKMPEARLGKILINLEPKIIITTSEYNETLKKAGAKDAFIIDINAIDFDGSGYDEVLPEFYHIIDTDPAYVIYTSGSTGIPKGVVISHRGIFDYIDWAIKCYAVTSQEKIGNQAPFYFDNSTLDLYLCLATGAELIIIPETLFSFPVKLLDFVHAQEISFIFWVPSVLLNIANTDSLNREFTSSLKKILFAGEVMPNKQLNYWRKHLPQALYSNLYGPTEITVDCTYYIVDRLFKDDESLPIGFPCHNTAILILNEQNKEIQEREIGELCVRGSSLALGYWNDFEKTKEVFTHNPLNPNYPERIYRTGDLVTINEKNEIIFIGRKDSQIKHMGYRIELGEIETAVVGINEIDSACVLYHYDKKQITVFYESKSGLESKEIRARIGEILPKYMIPTVYYLLNEMPRNANGKIDRNQLKQQLEGA